MGKSLAEFAPAGVNIVLTIFPATCASEKISHRRAGNPCVGQPVFSALFALFSLAGDSPPASKRTIISRKFKAVRCEAVLPEQKCSQTRKRPQRILCVFSRALTRYEGTSARQNRVCPCQSTQAPENQNIFSKESKKRLQSARAFGIIPAHYARGADRRPCGASLVAPG